MARNLVAFFPSDPFWGPMTALNFLVFEGAHAMKNQDKKSNVKPDSNNANQNKDNTKSNRDKDTSKSSQGRKGQ